MKTTGDDKDGNAGGKGIVKSILNGASEHSGKLWIVLVLTISAVIWYLNK
jgi:hypothetical protein